MLMYINASICIEIHIYIYKYIYIYIYTNARVCEHVQEMSYK